MGSRVLLGVLALLAGLWLATAPSFAQGSVEIRAGQHDGYGRIVFAFTQPVLYETDLTDGVLEVRFDRRFDTQLGGIVAGLRRYVDGVEMAGGGSSVRFQLTGDFALRSFYLGNSVVVDLLDRGVQARAEQNAAIAGAPLINVRTGQHPDHTRLVFDWPEQVAYQASQNGDRATLRFAAPGRVDLDAIRAKRLPFVRVVAAETGPDHLEFRVTMEPGAQIRHFYNGNNVVLDVLRPDPNAPARPPTAETAAPTVAEAPAPGPGSTTTPPTAERAGGPISLLPPKNAETAPPGADTPVGAPAPVAAESAPVEEIDAVNLRFEWREPVAAAVFRRAGYLWVIFDKEETVDPRALRAAAANVIRGVEQVPLARATALRMLTVAGVNPRVRRDGLAWVLEFRRQDIEPATKLDVVSQPNSPAGARLFIPVPEATSVYALTDPEIGDTLIVVPVIPLSHGIEKRRDFPQVQILPTAQGVALRPLSDQVRVRGLGQGVEITSEPPLALSPLSAREEATLRVDASQPLTRIFEMREWAGDPDVLLYKRRQGFEMAAALAPDGDDKKAARLALARFEIANSFAPEGMGVLGVMVGADPAFAETAEYRSLHGVGNFLMGRFEEALDDFNHDSVTGLDEINLWKAAIEIMAGNAALVEPVVRRSAGLMRGYPRDMMMLIGLPALEAAIEVGDVAQAEHYFEAMELENPKSQQRAQLDFLRGRLQELTGEFDTAVATWESVMEGPHRPSRARAAVARADLLRKLGEITTAEAIEELEKLRFAWRGDNFEFRLLRKLGDLYLQEGDYRNGLRTLRQAATYFRANPKAPEVTQQMVQSFEDMYLAGGADRLPPVTAIALYEEFKELTPAGAKGDQMIRRLADRLVAVDLLPQGAELLENQVQYRLEGLEKARVGTRLALVYLLDEKPTEAARILEQSKVAGIPDDLSLQRSHLMARALMEMDRDAESLQLLDGDESPDADRLRADIFWKLQDWGEASKVLRNLIKSSGIKPGQPLDPKQARLLLNQAISLTLSANERGMAQLRRDYAGAMAETDLASAFRLISSPNAQGLIDYRTVAGKVKDVESFQSFMSAYKERLANGGLSTIN